MEKLRRTSNLLPKVDTPPRQGLGCRILRLQRLEESLELAPGFLQTAFKVLYNCRIILLPSDCTRFRLYSWSLIDIFVPPPPDSWLSSRRKRDFFFLLQAIPPGTIIQLLVCCYTGFLLGWYSKYLLH